MRHRARDQRLGCQAGRALPVTIEAPAHGEKTRALNRRFGGDVAVALDASDAGPPHVDRVIEVDEVRHQVHPVPANRLAGEVAAPDRLEQRASVPHLVVAPDADLGGGHPRVGRALRTVMAVEARDAVVTDVMAVIELHGLLDWEMSIEVVGCPGVQDRDDKHAGNGESDHDEPDPECRVGPWREDRRHRAPSRKASAAAEKIGFSRKRPLSLSARDVRQAPARDDHRPKPDISMADNRAHL